MSLTYHAKKTKKVQTNDIFSYFVEGYKLPPKVFEELYAAGKLALQEADPITVLANEAKNLARDARLALFPEMDIAEKVFDDSGLFDEDKGQPSASQVAAPESLTKTNIHDEPDRPKVKPKPKKSLRDQGVKPGDLALAQIVEAILMCSRNPMTSKKIAAGVVGATDKEVDEAIQELNQFYIDQQRSFRIFEIAGGYQMRTDALFDPWLKEIYTKNKIETLTPSTLETLAIVAYKQPITKSEVDSIRGVDSSGHIRNLLEKDMVEVKGKSDELGNPNLYGTTKRFLEIYGLNSLEDLPNLSDLKE